MDASATRRSPRSSRTLNHVADRFDLRRDIQFDTRVTAARPSTRPPARWTRRAPIGGDDVTAQFVVMATGCLSSANMPDIPGLDSLRGRRRTTPAAGRTRASTSPASASA